MPNSLRNKTVDIWRADLESIARDEYSLDDDEQQRLRKFRRESDAHQFAASRTALRRILATYLQVAPQKIVFSYNACGKPFVENSAWQFNLSHCENLALIAVSRNAVGIDLEKVDESRAQRIKNLLSPEDVDENLTTREVCELWVKLEALVKARGKGLSVPLPPLRVLESGHLVELLNLDSFVAAVALELPFDVCWRSYCELAFE